MRSEHEIDVALLSYAEWMSEVQVGDPIMGSDFQCFPAERRDLLRLNRSGHLTLAPAQSAKDESWILTNSGEQILSDAERARNAARAAEEEA